MRVLIQWIVTLAILGMVAAGQSPTLKKRTPEDREREFQANHRIVLNVQVTDGSGKPVTDLEAKDFTVFDNHEPCKLVAFHVIDGEAMNDATEVVILLDAVNSNPEALEAQKLGIFKYLAQSRSNLPYPTAFVLWSNGHLKATAATRERNAVGKAFVSMTKGLHSNACGLADEPATKAAASEPGTPDATDTSHAADVANCLQVHFRDSLAALDGIAGQQRHIGGRTILIWVGAGWPMLSDGDIAQMSPKVRKSYSDELITILNDMRNSQITVDALAAHANTLSPESGSANQQELTAKTASAPDAGLGGLALQRIAQQTGGRVITESNDIPGDLGRLLNDADFYYALSVNPPPASSGVELRSLDVKVNRTGLNVRTMTAYYTEQF